MRLGELRRYFLQKAGRNPAGWRDLWTAFLAVLREPIDDREVLHDLVQLDIVPPRPYADYVGVDLSRVLAVPGSDPDFDLEAGLYVTASWSNTVDVGSEIIAATGKGPSSYESDPAPNVDQFAQLVERLPAVQRLETADDLFLASRAHYKRPTRRD